MQKAAKHGLLMAAVLALAASAGAADLFNNTNGGGVLNRAPNPAFFTLSAPAHVTQLVTYHWNNGRGAFPGTISLRYQNGQIFGPFPARGYQGQGGAPNLSWMADVNVTIHCSGFRSQHLVLQPGFAILRGA